MEQHSSDVLPRPDRAAIDRIVQQIVDLVQPLRIILFGSAARDEATPGSDVDLLVVMPDGTPQRETAQKLYRQVVRNKTPIDLAVSMRNKRPRRP